MSAFGGKADMTFVGSPLSRSLLGVKRTWVGALHMSAFDPKRTSLVPLTALLSTRKSWYGFLSRPQGQHNEAARFHYSCRVGSLVPACGPCAAASRPGPAHRCDGGLCRR